MNVIADDILMHVGVGKLDGAPGRGSGRYELGSGDNPFQRPKDFRERVRNMRKNMSEKEVADALGMSTGDLREALRVARHEHNDAVRKYYNKRVSEGETNRNQILRELKDKYGVEMGESTLRSILDETATARQNVTKATADYIRQAVDAKGLIDVGEGVELTSSLGGISRERLNTALAMLQKEGYVVVEGRVPQATDPSGDRQTIIKVIGPPGTQKKDAYDYGNIHSLEDYDMKLVGGDAIRPRFAYPESMDSSRLKVVYGDEGGDKKDGLIEIRRGVPDLSLGDSHYAQVRILVDDKAYLKGMAVYNDDMPEGVDVIFNTNKPSGTRVLPETPKDKNSVLKPIKMDPETGKPAENPFGSYIKDVEEGGQMYYDDPKGKYVDPVTGHKQSLSLINKRGDEGDWKDWSDKVPSQFLSKQPMAVLQKQLNLTKAEKLAEYEEIKKLTNPAVKQQLLDKFASDCDATAVNLKAASFPNQKYKVILPLTDIKDTEVYAPGYDNGTQLALIRYPHAGQFEIPIVTVNNKNAQGKKYLSNIPKDAVGISKTVADRLSGADFDGDTVMAIPLSDKVRIKNQPALEGLKGFDPKLEYGGRPDGSFKPMTKLYTQKAMGQISNLITDMTIKGATTDEIARAVRHSMVVIDAEKHKLDYQASYRDNGIAALKKKYMGHIDEDGKYSEGASTLISLAGSEYQVPKTQGSPRINQKGKVWYDPSKPEGALITKLAPDDRRFYPDSKTGKIKERTKTVDRMSVTDDPYTLVSEARKPQELAYAEYSKFMKDLANDARREKVYTPNLKQNKAAAKEYEQEAKDLDAKLRLSKLNQPRERLAQLRSQAKIKARQAALEESDLDKKEIKERMKKYRQITIETERQKVGARRKSISFTDREWKAIQSGAISHTKLVQLLRFADIDQVRKLATPKATVGLTAAQQRLVRSMAASGYTTEEIAKRIGRSVSTIYNYL